MSTFRLKARSRRCPEPGDVLESMATGNRWRVLHARPAAQHAPDPRWPHSFVLEIERVARDVEPPDDGRLWPFERFR